MARPRTKRPTGEQPKGEPETPPPAATGADRAPSGDEPSVARVSRLEAEIADVKAILGRLEPKVNEAFGLSQDIVPGLVTKAELAELHAALERERAALDSAMRRDLVELRETAQQGTAELRQAVQQDVADGRRASEAAAAEVGQTVERGLGEIREAHQRDTAAVNEKVERALAELRHAHQQDVTALREALDRGLGEVRHAAQNEVAALRQATHDNLGGMQRSLKANAAGKEDLEATRLLLDRMQVKLAAMEQKIDSKASRPFMIGAVIGVVALLIAAIFVMIYLLGAVPPVS